MYGPVSSRRGFHYQTSSFRIAGAPGVKRTKYDDGDERRSWIPGRAPDLM
jgi:hypothetical protein